MDDEVLFLSSLREGLERSFPAATFHCAPDGEIALELLDRYPIDLVVTDLKMPVLDGFGLLAHMTSRHPEVPALVMTSYATDATEDRLRDAGAVHCIDKPIALSDLVDRIEKIIEPPTGGTLRGVSLPAFLQLLGMEQLTGVVHVRGAAGAATLYLRVGQVVHAESASDAGLGVALRTLSLPNVEIELRQQPHRAPRSITMSLTELLLEAARLSDEGAGRNELAQVDLDDAFSEFGLSDDARVATTEAVLPMPAPLVDYQMSTARSMLQAVMQIDGALGVALVDCDTAAVLDSIGGIGALAIREVAASNTEVVRAKLKTLASLGIKDVLEDILITVGTQYHVIRSFARRPSLFVYLELDRERTNLGMARHLLADMERRVFF